MTAAAAVKPKAKAAAKTTRAPRPAKAGLAPATPPEESAVPISQSLDNYPARDDASERRFSLLSGKN